MRRGPDAIWIFTGSAVLLALALAWTAGLLAREPARRQAWRRLEARLTRLEALEREALALEALRVPFAEAGPAADTGASARGIFTPESGAAVVIETADHEGWRLQRVTVDYGAVDYETLESGIRQAEALRPPLKLAEIVLEAAPGRTGSGRARLVFERIDMQVAPEAHGRPDRGGR